MPSREYYENEATQHNPLNIFKVIGQSTSLSTGWAAFAFKTFTVSTGGAAIFGLASYMLFSSQLGPVLPLLGGAAAGFTGGVVHRWNTDRQEAACVLRRYPDVMEYHMRLAEPHLNRVFDTTDGGFAAWAAKLDVVKESQLISALYSASDSLQRIRDAEEQALIAKYTE